MVAAGIALPCSSMAEAPSGSSCQATGLGARGGEGGVDHPHGRRDDLGPDAVAEHHAEAVGAGAHSDAGAVTAGSSRTHQVRTLTNSRMPAAASSRP